MDTIQRKLGLSQTTFAITVKVVTEDYQGVVVIKKFVMDINFKGLNLSIMQIILCGLVVTVNLPIYQGLFIRTDKGNIPSSIMFKSTVLASLMCFTPIYWDTSPCIIIFLLNHIPKHGEDGRWVWIGLLGSELWFGFYWLLTQALRWSRTYRFTFKDRLSQRFENELPGVDIFVCTADPTIEPPMMVINTVLSVMAYDYPPEKLSVYLSDDGGSDLTFYALLEASEFAKQWIPFCKKFNVEPRSPSAYFASISNVSNGSHSNQAIKKLYKGMENRIENATKLGRVPSEIRSKHKGFTHWDSYSSPRDHDSIVHIFLNGRDPNTTDVTGSTLPTLVYLAREKRPQHFHNFKAGAMNALIRVSSKISNGQIILNVDCDMYSNDSKSIRDALCFLMDEKKGHEIAFIQFSQYYENITRNDLYGGSLLVIREVEFNGLDGFGGPLYTGSGCFHRRDTFLGRKFSIGYKHEEKRESTKRESVLELEAQSKELASCTYEENTQWGKEVGLKYGCPVEDVITGLSIQSKGWKSVYYNPPRKAFLGVAPTTLSQTLVQHKRWSEGDLQILLSKYSPACLAEFLWSGGTILGWWNEQRIWLYKRASSYLFAFIDTILKSLGFSESGFIITAKVADEDVSRRYQNEIMEFGTSTPMFTILATLALLNLACFVGVVKQLVMGGLEGIEKVYETMFLQILLCGVLVLINWPLYQGLFLRKDKGRLPSSLAVKSVAFALFACICFIYLN
ncbi:hypothetical protein FEM48_Zijuj01G0255000 [Ziziphus jujuba var. spinosa]|uniref:Cellulose synthase-like protein E1 n=1 Tax=Ziziphus jujuba var. spinosa TaxID=714518 RepID=A0A978W4R2_ZIZJJ|nr:hypothetical protein FEM48_Zijuj01G0255000 [Ziziphus jujuba var. spinosa]